METLLASNALHVSTENEVYTLLGSWVHQSQFGAAYDGIHSVSVTGCLPLFERLVKFVRFQHLSLEFIGNVVTACPLANQAGLLPSILRSSLVTRETEPRLVAKNGGTGSVPLDRGRGGTGWTYTSTLKLTDLLPLAKSENLYMSFGLVDDYPLVIKSKREAGKQEETSFGFSFNIIMPVWKAKEWEGCLSRSASFEYRLRVEIVEKGWYEHLFDGKFGRGYRNLFEKTWEETTRRAPTFLVARLWWR